MGEIPEAGGDTRHGEGHQVVEVPVGGGGQLQGAEADVIECFVVNAESLVCVLDKLVDGQGCVVRFHHGVRHLVRQVIKHTFKQPMKRKPS